MTWTRKLPATLSEGEEPHYGEGRVSGRGQQDPACTAGNTGGCEDITELDNDSGHLGSALDVRDASWRRGREEERSRGRRGKKERSGW